MKKIDRLLLGSFIPPFVVTFFIALFVLLMQVLWVYIDDIIGKGAGLGMITEFMFYLSIAQFFMALPIAVLLSSVMVMGNLAEHYELSSMKSAGVSLLRIMRPLVYACTGIAFFSWFTANYVTPIANLKFKSRLYDMRKQKPTLNMEEGVFNDDFEGYRIRIGEKGSDNKTIKDVFIANHITIKKDRLNELVAEKGLMYTTPDERYLVMELENGEQFQEGNRHFANAKKAPFIRTSFSKYTKIFDMKEFDISRTDEELFRTHYSMLSIRQLKVAIDSIDKQMLDRKTSVSNYIDQYINAFKEDTLAITITENTPKDTAKIPLNLMVADTQNHNAIAHKNRNSTTNYSTSNVSHIVQNDQLFEEKRSKAREALLKKVQFAEQTIDKPLKEYASIVETFVRHKREPYISKATQQSRSIKSNAESGQNFITKTKEKRVKHVFELYSKYAYAVVCVVFLFIGAPMGALVRKGGFGYPLLIAIIFFMLYVTLTLTFKRMAEAFVVPTILAVWLPNLIILPIGLFLTYKAMNDSKVFDATRLKTWFSWFFGKFRKQSSDAIN